MCPTSTAKEENRDTICNWAQPRHRLRPCNACRGRRRHDRMDEHQGAGGAAAQTRDGRSQDHGAPGARPRCQAMVPSVKKLIDAARANNMMIAYNLTGAGKVEDMVDPGLAPRAGDHMIKEGRGANKFYNSSLEPALKEKGIR